MWECEWKQFKASNSIKNSYTYPTENLYRMSEKQILSAIIEDQLFGVAEVDIHVPDNLKAHFQEMTPVFKNIVVKEADIGDFMQQYLKETGQKFKDRRYLIGSMFGVKILLISPLIKWYIAHGLVVTKIHQIIEFCPKTCFRKFADQVTNDRRAGDADPSLKVLGDTSKLIGEFTIIFNRNIEIIIIILAQWSEGLWKNYYNFMYSISSQFLLKSDVLMDIFQATVFMDIP